MDSKLNAENDLTSLMETAYLLRSPKNAERLFAALEWSKANDLKQQRQVEVESTIAELKEDQSSQSINCTLPPW